MSCLLVALSSIYIHPAELNNWKLSLLVARDAMLAAAHLTFDRNLWRRRGENVNEYRERVDNAFMRVHTIPPTSNIMVIMPSMTKDEIKQLPTSVYYVEDMHETRVRIPTDETVHSTNGMCACCLEDYRNGDLLKILPCTHKLHDLCITDWLLIKSTCPVCNGMVKACE